MTKEQAIALGESGWWLGKSAHDIAMFQLFEEQMRNLLVVCVHNMDPRLEAFKDQWALHQQIMMLDSKIQAVRGD